MAEIPSNGPERRETAEIVDESLRGVVEAIHRYHKAITGIRIAENGVSGLREFLYVASQDKPPARSNWQLTAGIEARNMFNQYVKETERNIHGLTGEKPFYKFTFEETLGHMHVHGSAGYKLTDNFFIGDEIKADAGGMVLIMKRDTESFLTLRPTMEFGLELASSRD